MAQSFFKGVKAFKADEAFDGVKAFEAFKGVDAVDDDDTFEVDEAGGRFSFSEDSHLRDRRAWSRDILK
jgi:hypothetical protein